MTTANILSQLGSPGVSTGFKNRIINGAMVIDQRNAGASVTPTSNATYTLDRWTTILTIASKFSVQQNAGSVTPPVGFTNYLGVTSLSAYTVGSAEQFGIRQSIEGYNTADLGWGTANAKTVTLSFWVRSSLTGTFGGSLRNADGTRSYPFSYIINSANTWEYETITIAGDTTGTWNTTNSNGIQLAIGLGNGSVTSGTAGAWASANYTNATGATSVVGTNGATFYITGVQLEVGTTATNFDFRSYGTELALCQRYYEVFGVGGVGSSTTNASAQAIGFKYQVAKRATPTITHLANYSLLWAGNSTYTATATVANNGSTTGIQANVTVSAAPTDVGRCLVYATASDNISASAEL